MQLFGLAGEERTGFTRCPVADGDNQIERLARKLIPGLAARLAGIDAMTFQSFDGFRMHMPGGKAARADSFKLSLAKLIEKRFGHDRPAGITGAQDQYFLWGGHQPQQSDSSMTEHPRFLSSRMLANSTLQQSLTMKRIRPVSFSKFAR